MKRLIPLFSALIMMALLAIPEPVQAQYSDFQIQLGIWQTPTAGHTHFRERVGPRKTISGGPGTVVSTSLGSPSNGGLWFEVEPDDPVDFSRADLFHRIGLVLWSANPWGLVGPTTWGGSYPELAPNFFPLTAKVTITATPSGGGSATTVFDQTITWEYNPSETGGYGFYWWHNKHMGYNVINYGNMSSTNWKSPNDYYNGTFHMRFEVISQPENGGTGVVNPPSYSIDYYNERTNKVVGSDDQYSWDNSNWTTGTGGYVNIAPGNTVYFRKVADNSKKQTITAGSRPSTPWYSLDYSGEQTAQVVASTVQYSSSSSMSGAISATGSAVSVSPGTDLYFRVKATSSSYASNVFTLDVKNRTAAPSFSVDFDSETTEETLSSTQEYAVNSDMSGAISGTGGKITLTPGTDLYIRNSATASDFASTAFTLDVPARPAQPVFTIDYVNEQTAEDIDMEHEYSTSADFAASTLGNNAPVEVVPGSSLYLRHSATATDFRSTTQNLAAPDRPAGPNISIDYSAETTAESITAETEYSAQEDMSSAQAGSGSVVAVSPGSNLYFRAAANGEAFGSEVATLEVPDRPAGPAYGIHFGNEQSLQVIPETVEYSENMDMSAAVSGSGVVVDIVPGTNLYFRSAALSDAFASEISTLEVPARPDTPEFAIDFENEQTTGPISHEYIYSGEADMSSPVIGKNQPVVVSPGMNLYFQKNASAASFKSEIQAILLPERPEAPVVEVNFVTEETASAIGSELAYALNENMTAAVDGNGSMVALIPGMDMYFQIKPTDQNFSSEIYLMDVPERPSVSCEETGSTDKNPFQVLFFFFEEVNSLETSGITTVNSRVDKLTSLSAGADLSSFSADIISTAVGEVHVQLEANALTDGSFASEVFSIDFTGEPNSISKLMAGGSFTLYPNPAKESFSILSHSGSYVDVLVEVYSAEGRKLDSRKVNLGESTLFHLPEAAKGPCFVRVQTPSGTSIMKLIVQ